MRRWLFFLAALGLLLGGVGRARAGSIIVDEDFSGIGTVGIGFIGGLDPGPGAGLASVLTYTLPFAGVQGDVLLKDGSLTGPLGDVIRFNGNGTLIFYSDSVPLDSVADGLGFPGAFYANQATVVEIGPEDFNRAMYTPTAGQPGFDISNPTYTFISDGRIIPEPANLTLLAIGIAGMAGYGWRQRKKAEAR